MFNNFYECPDDGTHWIDEWHHTSNDRCPTCGKEIQPYHSEDVNESNGTLTELRDK